MVQKHIIISMIAPVAIAGILIMAMTAISSINQAFAVGEESNNTGNEATSHESNNNGNEATSHESKNTGTALSAQGEEQQSNNTGKKPTELTVSASINGPAETSFINGFNQKWVPVKFSGRLTSEGSGVAGAEIKIDISSQEENEEAYTDSGGHYSVVGSLNATEPTTDKIQAYTGYNTILNDYKESKSAVTTIHVGATSQKSSNTGGAQQESKNTGNEATSHKSKNTGTALSAQGAEQQSKNTGKKPTELTISASINGNYNETEIPVKFSGRLTSEGSGVANVTIVIIARNDHYSFQANPDTDSGGHYSVVQDLQLQPKHLQDKTYKIEAYTSQAGFKELPSDYKESDATTTIQLP